LLLEADDVTEPVSTAAAAAGTTNDVSFTMPDAAQSQPALTTAPGSFCFFLFIIFYYTFFRHFKHF